MMVRTPSTPPPNDPLLQSKQQWRKVSQICISEKYNSVCVCGRARKDDSRSDYSHTWLNHTQRRHTSQAITVLFLARQGRREKRKHNWQLPTVDSGSVATTCASQATEAGHTNEKRGNGGQPETDHHHHNCNKYNDNHDQQHLHPLQTIEQYLTDVTHRS